MLELGRDRAMAGALPVTAALVSLAAMSETEAGTTLCIFRRCTGGYCPGCGGARSAWALLQGDLARSWTIHPWVLLIVVQLVVAACALVRFGRTSVRRLLVPVLVANIALGVGIWVTRLATGAIPVPFG